MNGEEMKWFKHVSASFSDPDIMQSEVKFKTIGPYVFWRTLEVLSKENAIDKKYVIDFKTFKMYFPSVSVKKLKEILSFFDEKERITSSYVDENIILFCNKLSTISDNYTSKLRRDSEETSKNVSPIEEEVEEEVEEDSNNTMPTTPSKAKIDYKSVYDYYMTLDLKKHRNYTDAMSKAIKMFMKNTSSTIQDCKDCLDRHVFMIRETKDKDFPITVRPLAEFFGQKAYGAKHLIGEDYLPGNKHYREKYTEKLINQTQEADLSDEALFGECD